MRDEQRKTITAGLDMILEAETLFLAFQPGTLATIEDVVRFIREEQISGITLDTIRAAFINKSSGRVRLANRSQIGCRAASAQIQVSSDGLIAKLVLNRAGFAGQGLKRQELDDVLAQAHVVFGLDQQLLNRVADGEITAGTHVVASGLPAQPGEPASLIYHVLQQAEETGDTRVDYREVGKILNVEVGQLLVTKTPAGAGTPGTTVTSAVIVARPGRDCPLPMGKGVVPSDDGLRVYAALSGHVVFAQRRVEVLPSYELSGDVDFSSGNIDFNGNVIIRGNVHNGFKVSAQGHVEIAGGVDNAQIKAGGHIVVKGGVQGQRSTLTAGGCISCKYVENGQLEAGDSILVGEAIMHSRVVARCRVTVEGRKGLIVGGFVRAGDEIHAKAVGSPLATPTELEVGVEPAIKDEFNQVMDDCRKAAEHIDKSEKAVVLLTQMQERLGALPQDKQLLLSQLRLGLKAKRIELDAGTNRRLELEAVIGQAQDGKVRVKDTLYPGVRIIIGASSYRVRDTMAGATFRRVGVDVTVLPYA